MFDMTTDPMAHQPQTQQLPFSLPPYPQMIMEAIEAANDENGCNKTSIAKYIESTQLNLPPSHTTLLNYHLNQMKNSGQIVIVKNNYMKPDPNAPPKRGRGRPPKPKPEADSSHVAAAVVSAPSVSPPRPRGRPPKSKDSQIEPTKPKEPSTERRGRGRPPKKPKTESESETVKAEEAPTVAPANGERRGRGRPPKVKPAMVPVGC